MISSYMYGSRFYLLVEPVAWIGRLSNNCMSASCAHLVCFSILDSKWYWNHTGYHTVGAVCLFQKRIKRGSQAAITSHTYMSMPKEQRFDKPLIPDHSLSLSAGLWLHLYHNFTTV
jgi:hypothetical protein